ncbi:MAG TPA: ABC transporter permease [Cyclobacteriaceae bacterium]|nr:ABC transporter permease [Cyclobacteriaceae bacterium]
MLLSYFTVALRNLLRHKLFSLINIGGLAVGLAAFWMLALYVGNELSFDRYHEKADRIFRIAQHAQWDGGNFNGAVTQVPYAAAMKADFPEVEEAVRIDAEGGGTFSYNGKEFRAGDLIFADNSFFKVFTYKFLYGDAGTAFSKPRSIVITRSLAQVVFGDPSVALNKALEFGTESYLVTGVIENVPSNSHFTFSGVRIMPEMMEGTWMNSGLYTYILLREGTDIRSLEAKMPAFFERNMKASMLPMEYRAEFQPLTSIHLYSSLDFELGANGSITYVYVFSAIAALILLIASINYMNLSTARSSLRIRETGLRKVVGSRRGQLILLFLTESVFITMIASVLSIFVMTLAMPLFETFTGAAIDIWKFGIANTIGVLVLFSVVAGTLSGIYPAFFLSGFRVVPALKGLTGSHEGNILFRQGLVVFQFTATIAMIAGSIVIYRQLDFVTHKDLGFNKDQVITFHLNGSDVRTKVNTIREELLRQNLVEDVATAGNPIGNNNIGGRDYKIEMDGKIEDRTRMANYFTVDEDFIPTLQIEVTEGRNFSREFITDKDQSVIVNEALVYEAGWDEAVGKKIQMGEVVLNVVGVVKNFNIYSLQHEVGPLILQLPREQVEKDNMYVRIGASDMPTALSFIEETYKKYDAGAFEYNFLDQNFERQYRAEQLQGKMLLTFTALAISIACLGLFGLITFTTEQRRKEIGIRKVLGGSVAGIVILLARNLLILVLVSSVIATPIAWYMMNGWLQEFAYHVEIGAWIFLAAGLTALLIAMITVSSQAARSALANPVDSLRTE